MEKTDQRIDIFQYHDYREFLRDYLQWLKRNRRLSMRAIAKDADISHGYLSLVLKCQRNLSSRFLKKLLPALDLSKAEGSYLQKLVILGDSPSDKMRNKAFKSMKSSIAYKEKNPQELGTYKYLEKWYYVAIRELVLTKGFKNDPEWIRNCLPFPIRTHEVVDALDFLITNGFLRKDKSGKISVTEKNVKCAGGVYQLSLGNYHRTMLGLAQEGIERFSKEDRKQIGYTTGIDRKDFDKVKAILEEARSKIKELEKKSSKKSDAVYHINLSAFPIAGEDF